MYDPEYNLKVGRFWAEVLPRVAEFRAYLESAGWRFGEITKAKMHAVADDVEAAIGEVERLRVEIDECFDDDRTDRLREEMAGHLPTFELWFGKVSFRSEGVVLDFFSELQRRYELKGHGERRLGRVS